MEFTPQEKAEVLVNEVLETLYDNGSLSFKGILYSKAKECALITVKRINEAIDFDWMEVQNLESQHRYYDDVEQEIKKLEWKKI